MLTHPASTEKWWGVRFGDPAHFFRLVDGDNEVAVLKSSKSTKLLDRIPFQGDQGDPRRDLERLATEWARDRGYLPKDASHRVGQAGRR